MAKYIVTGPDGKKYKVEAPEGTTNFEIQKAVQAQISGPVAPSAAPNDNLGFTGGAYNAAARGTSDLINSGNVSMAEDFAGMATYERDRAARDEAGELPWWERILTAEFGERSDPDALEARAGELAGDAATRYNESRKNYPMTAAGAAQLQNITETTNRDGFLSGLGQVVKNPMASLSGLSQVVGEQAPAFGAAILSRNPKVAVGAFAGTGYNRERFGQLVPEAAKAGYNLLDPDQARAAVADEEFMKSQEQRGFTRGAIIGAVDLFTAGLASKASPTLRGLAANTGAQVVAGGGGEALAQLATDGEIDAGEVLIEALAEGVSAPVDVAAFGAQRVYKKLRNPESSETELDSEQSLFEAGEEAQVIEAREAEQDAIDQEQKIQTDQQHAARRVAAQGYTKNDYKKQFDAELDANLINPETPLGAEFLEFANGLEAYDAADIKKAKTEFLKTKKNEIAASQQAGFINALDTRAAEIQANGGVLPVAPEGPAAAEQFGPPGPEQFGPPGPEQYRMGPPAPEVKPAEPVTPTKPVKPEGERIAMMRAYAVEKLGPDWETIGGFSQEFTDRKGFYTKKQGKWGFQASVDAEVKAQADLVTANENEASDGARKEAIQYANEKLGTDWVQTYPKLVNALTDITPAAFRKEVDAAAPEAAEPTDVVDPDPAAPLAKALTKMKSVAGLSENEANVFGVLNDYFLGDKQDSKDDVTENGKIAYAKVAKLAGSKTANSARGAVKNWTAKFLVEVGDLKPNATAKQKKDAIANFKFSKPVSGVGVDVKEDTGALDNSKGAPETSDDSASEINDDAAGKSDGSVFSETGMNARASVGKGNYALVDADGSRNDRAYNRAEKKAAEEDPNFVPVTVKQLKEYTNEKAANAEGLAEETAKLQKRAAASAVQAAIEQVRLNGAETYTTPWNSLRSEGAPDFGALRPEELAEWIFAVDEANQDGDNARLADDQRILEQAAMTRKPELSNEEAVDATEEQASDDNARANADLGTSPTSGSEAATDTSADTPKAPSKAKRRAATKPAKEVESFDVAFGNSVNGLTVSGSENADIATVEVRSKPVTGLDGTQYDSIFDTALPFGAPVNLVTKKNNKLSVSTASKVKGDKRANFVAATVILPLNATDDQISAAAQESFKQWKANYEGVTTSEAVPEGVQTPGAKFGFFAKVLNGTVGDAPKTATPATFEKLIKDLTGSETNWKINLYDSTIDVIEARLAGDITDLSASQVEDLAYGWVSEDENGIASANFILDRIPAGTESSAFMHEVASHIGIDSVLPVESREKLTDQIITWADKKDDSLESTIAVKALQRVKEAAKIDPRMATDNALVTAETIAYFIEEATVAGVEPSVKTPLGRFLRQLYAAFKKALRTLNINTENLTAQNVVDLAYGAARMELVGRKHGTTADFRRFNHKYMNTGEGAQAFGWGSYLAERFSIARWYMRTDEKRKLADNLKGLPGGDAKETLRGMRLPSSAAQPATLAAISWSARKNHKSNHADPEYLKAKNADRVKKGQRPLDEPEFIISVSTGTPPLGSVFAPDELVAELKLRVEVAPDNFVAFDPEQIASFTVAEEALFQIDPEVQKDLDAIKAVLLDQYVKHQEYISPDGNLMTIDTLVADEDMLPWRTPISEAPKVFENLVLMFTNRFEAEDTLGIMYRAFENLENYRLSPEGKALYPRVKARLDMFQANIVAGKPHRASDIRGYVEDMLSLINGRDIYTAMKGYDQADWFAQRFEDAGKTEINNILLEYVSPEAVAKTVTDNHTNMRAPVDEAKIGISTIPVSLHRSDKVVSMVLDEFGIGGIIYSDAGTMGNQDDGDGTANNVVIFNEDNLVVVGRSPSKNVSDVESKVNRIKFGVRKSSPQEFGNFVEKRLGENFGQFATDFAYLVSRPLKALMTMTQVVENNKEALPSLKVAHDELLESEKTVTEFMLRLDPLARQVRQLTQDRLNLVNEFIAMSTFTQQWGYDPKIDGKTTVVNETMKRAFGRLKAPEQAIVTAVFQHGIDVRNEMDAEAKRLGLPKEFTFNSKLDGPYAPMKRTGDFFAELKSTELAEAEAAFTEESNKSDNKEATKKTRELVEKLKGEKKHYELRAFGTLGQADRYVKSKQKDYNAEASSATAKEIGFDQGQRVDPKVLTKVMAALGADEKVGLDSSTLQAVSDVVNRIYTESLSENNARLSGVRRKNRAGFDKNMMQSFFMHSHAQSRLMAQMKHGKAISAAIASARTENSKINNRSSQEAYNLFAGHYQQYVNPFKGPWTPISDRIASINTVTTLTSSVGYHTTNAIQPIITQQKMAADFNDYAGAAAAQLAAYKVAKAVIDGKGTNIVKNMAKQVATTVSVGLIPTITGVDVNNEVVLTVEDAPPHLRSMLKGMQLKQLLDKGIEQDLNFDAAANTGMYYVDKASEEFKNVSDRLYQTARYVEAYNRVSSAVAAFEMAKKHPKRLAEMNMTAEEYATSVVQDTQGNFSALDAPLAFKILPKLTTQYRKYQLMMANLWANAFRRTFTINSLATNKVTKAERAIGARMLLVSGAHTTLLAGVVGLPMINQFSYLLGMMLGEEDDPDFDLERHLRTKTFKDNPEMADFLTRGGLSLLGLDMSQKLKQSDIFSPFPYSELEPTEESYKNYVLEAGIGPTANTLGNMGKAHKYFAKGEFTKGMEYLLPKGLRTILASARMSNEGLTSSNGDPILKPEEIDLKSLLLNSLGLPATEIQKIKWTQGQQYEIKQYFSRETTKIIRNYVDAYKDRDRARMATERQAWQSLQKAKGRMRPFFNNVPGTLVNTSVMELIKAPQRKLKEERKNRRRITGNR